MKKDISKTKEPTLKDIAVLIDTYANSSNKNYKELSQSVDDLAVATKKGFDSVLGELGEFKSEMYEFRNEANMTLFNIDGKLRTVDQRLHSIEEILGPLMKVSTLMQN